MLIPKLNIFVDGGGNNYNGVKNYLKKLPHFNKIYIFEPNPKFHNEYKNSNLHLIKKAIWIKNGTIPFYLSKDKKQVSSSIIKEKLDKKNNTLLPDFFYENYIEVECVDFSDWINVNIKKNHVLTLKLDIEGAEYEVLNKMIKDKTINKIKNLYIEFHLDRMQNKQDINEINLKNKKEIHNNIIREIKKNNINLFNWD